MKKRILISDIAKELGVSVTTVSFVLNNKAKEMRISEKLADKILKYVDKVGYKPNQLAKSLRTGKTKMIGLLVEDIGNPFFANIARFIEQEAYLKSYHIVYCSVGNDDLRAKELVELFFDRQLDGFIITPTEGMQDTINNLVKQGVPVVLFDRYFPDLHVSHVVSDNLRGAYEATKHLLDNPDHSRVGLISLYSNQTMMNDRQSGYMQAMDESRKQAYIQKLSMDQSEEESFGMIQEFIVGNKLDAVLFSTNYLAISGLTACKSLGFKMPKFVAFDEHTVFSLMDPAITCVAQNIEALASELVGGLIQQIDKKQEEANRVVIPCQLIIRESSI
ncbi:MAG TPA: LacI family DNA-binding transcriptional regulator [Candidatus Sphingobacterium stercoripullorum]|nr:LacI family DNA-binding transcriptional regulator [Candidatus Sphingobacterium stercoripullorum]